MDTDRIESIRWLVEDEHVGLVQDRLCDPDTLPKSLAESMNRAHEMLFEPGRQLLAQEREGGAGRVAVRRGAFPKQALDALGKV